MDVNALSEGTPGALHDVRVRFVGGPAHHRALLAAPVNVPASLKRDGLSKLLNHMLAELPGHDKATPYEFLIGERLLRTSIAVYLQTHALSAETVIELRHMPALYHAGERTTITTEDWIACVDTEEECVVAGFYGGLSQVWTLPNGAAEGCTKVDLEAHSGPVKAIKLFNRATCVLTGSIDRSIHVSKVEGGKQAQTIAVLRDAHNNSVSSVDVMPPIGETGDINDARMATCSWDKSVKIWSLRNESTNPVQPKSKRPRKSQASATTSRVFRCEQTLGAFHTQAISSVHWAAPIALYSGSWDHSIAQWDVLSQHDRPVHSWNGTAPVSEVAFDARLGVLAAAHADRKVRLYDPRIAASKVVKLELCGHEGGWVNRVRWSPTDPHRLASCGNDGRLVVWDSRSTVPLFSSKIGSTNVENSQLLGMAWSGPLQAIFSGGNAKQLFSHTFQ